MNVRTIALSLVLALGVIAPTLAQPVITTLDNGLTVCAIEDRSCDTAVVQVVVHVTADCEPANKAGLRAVLQHALEAAWSARLDEEPELDFLLEMEDLGAGIDIDTDWEYASVGYSGTSESLPDALAFLAAAVFRPTISEETHARTIELLKRAAGGPQASPAESTYALFRDALQDSVSRSYVLGTPETLDDITLADLGAFHKRFYVPNLTTVCVLAPMPADELTTLVTDRFGTLAAGDVTLPKPPDILRVSDSKARTNRALAIGQAPQLEIASMVVGVPAPSYDDPDMPVMYVIHALLGGTEGRHGRIDDDESLWDSLGLPFPRERARDSQFIETLTPPLAAPSYLAVHTYSSPRQVEAMRAGIVAEFKGIHDNPPGAQELSNAKEYVINSYSLLFESPRTRALVMARAVALGVTGAGARDFTDRVAAISSQDVSRVAERYFGHHAVGVEFPPAITDDGKPN